MEEKNPAVKKNRNPIGVFLHDFFESVCQIFTPFFDLQIDRDLVDDDDDDDGK